MTLTAEEVMYMYHLKKDPKRGRFRSSGWYYAFSRKGKNVIAGDHNSNKAEGWKSKWILARNWEAPTDEPHSFPVPTHYRTLGNSTRPTMTMEGMKKKLNEMRKNEVGEKRGNDGSEGSQSKKSKSSGLSLPPLTPSSLPSRSLTPTGSSSTPTPYISGSSRLPVSGYSYSVRPPSDASAQTLEGSSSSISVSVPPELSYFAKCSTKILSPAAINEMETISSDVQASLLTTLGVKMGYLALRQQATMAQLRLEVIDLRRGVMDQRVTISELEEKARCLDADSKLKEDTIQKLQDSLSKSETRIKELESGVIESEETNKKKIKDLEETMVQLEEKSVKALQELNSLNQIEHRYPDLDLSWVYEVEAPSGGTGDTPAGGIDGAEDPAA
ncbi:hypothetical protein FNV43_RR21908 [Rhamnella rubrinervis]|uniref:Uncharacterized protein n=1 Tax=Rhamnella rubrinervis TaxID=2594499 RepID=A0A8K0DU43_9ROSA|nr:hypothetical protein FNV43_RR21908 [Rhamnella rubrinervis]